MTDTTTSRGRTAGWWWPWLIGALLVATAGGQAIMLYAATHDPTFAIEPDYYKKAVAWDTTMLHDRENARIGWRATGSMTTASGSNAAIRVVVTDSTGTPVTGAAVRALMIHNLDSAHPLTVELRESGSAYAAEVAHPRRGLWEIRLDAVRGSTHFTPSFRLDYTP